MIYDRDFDVPLPAAQVLIAETGQQVVTSDEGNYIFSQVEPGTYTLVFSKEGYTRQVKADVVVSPGQMTELDISLSGEFTEMEEFIVQDVQIGTGTEAALLELRMESPALIDSVSADFMSKAGAGDAASALKLVSGATIQEGKYAVVRGLPDRYVNSQMNSVRLPSADPDKRAVQLDQFPSSIIESIQVTKTFTPDQQGDASGGAVNIVLKSIPNERILKVSSSIGFNTNTVNNDKFLRAKGGGVNFWGETSRLDLKGALPNSGLGIISSDLAFSRGHAPTDYKWSVSVGDKWDIDNDIRIGGFGTFYYERDSSYYENGINDSYWVPGGIPKGSFGRMEPKTSNPPSDVESTFRTALFDVTKGTQEVKWGGLLTIGLETENNSLSALYMFTRTAEEVALLAEDTRGKEAVRQFWGDIYSRPRSEGGANWNRRYRYNDPTHPGNKRFFVGDLEFVGKNVAPYQRSETIEYTERTTDSIQLIGRHTIPLPEIKLGNIVKFLNPELDWVFSKSTSTLYQPDKRLFGSNWTPVFEGGEFTGEGTYGQYKGADAAGLGNVLRIWKDIREESDQYSFNMKFPFEQWSGDEGYIKLGIFSDDLSRMYHQESYMNNDDDVVSSIGPWDVPWSTIWWTEPHRFEDSAIDVDYHGKQKIEAFYYMIDIPFTSYFKIIGGFRHEKTKLSITNYPEGGVYWYPDDFGGPVELPPGAADVDFEADDTLPSIGFELKPFKNWTFRGSYSKTLARQTFKELTPIEQREFIGGDRFIGNPALKMSRLKNYDLRLDWTPYQGGLVSLSWFHKKVKDPIEYVQRFGLDEFIKPTNFPKGELTGWEIELRQDMGRYFEILEGLTIGGNATMIESEVHLPDREIAGMRSVGAYEYKRDMLNAPEYLYNLFFTYNMANLGLPDTDIALFYTVRGDTLIAGPSWADNLVPSIYEKEYGTLNLSLSHKFWDIWTLKLQAKNLLDPDIKTVYRSSYIPSDVTHTSYKKGIDFSISLSAKF